MSDSARIRLRTLLVSRYVHLRKKLEYIVGSKDAAADALQETWLRLDTLTDATQIHNSDAYLLRMAVNIATDQHRRDQRHLSEGEIDDLFQVPDDLANPERIVAARREVETLQSVLQSLPERRRAILLAARVDGQMNREIAERFNISQSLVEKELRHALRYCKARMQETSARHDGGTRGRRKF